MELRRDDLIRMGELCPTTPNGTKHTKKWSQSDIPDQRGRVAIVTGANTGIGYHTAAALADSGAHVLGCGPFPNNSPT